MRVLQFVIAAEDGQARAGVVETAHGPVETPAFVPLASKGTVKSMLSAEVEALEYQMVLGNAYHLFINPGAEYLRRAGGLHKLMGWQQPIITDSGGFQVFSMGHGRVADEIKGRARGPAGPDAGAIESIEEEGVTFRSYLDGSRQFMGPEESMEIQAAIGSDIALAFDECTPFHSDRDYTANSMERTHRWLKRCIEWRQSHAPEHQSFYGIVQGGTYEDLREEAVKQVLSNPLDGIAIGGSLGDHKEQMYEVVGWVTGRLPAEKPRHLLGIGEIDDILESVALGIDTFDCAMPTRLARHGMALVPDPAKRWRLDLSKSPARGCQDPIVAGCECRACQTYSRGYLNYLIRSREITGVRLVTEHNLFFMARLMAAIRAAIRTGEFVSLKNDVLAGGPNWLNAP